MTEKAEDYAGDFWFKVDRRLFESSRWDDLATPGKLVLIYLIGKAQDPMNPEPGCVLQRDSVIARMCGVQREEVTAAIDALCSPDPTSRSSRNEGRTLERVDGGVRLLNFKLYHPRMIENRLALKSQRSEQARRAALKRWGKLEETDEAGAAGDSGGEPTRPRAVRRDRAGDVAAEAPQPVPPVKKPPKKGKMNPMAEAVFVQCRDIAQMWEKVDALMKGKVPIPDDQRDPATLLKTISEFDTGNGIKSTSDFTTLSEKWAQQIMGSGELDEMRHKAKKALFDAEDWVKKAAVDEPEEEEADPREELIDRVAEAANAAAKLLGRSPSEVLGVYGNPNEMALDELADFAARIEHDVAELKRNDAEMPPLPPEPERDTGGAPF